MDKVAGWCRYYLYYLDIWCPDARPRVSISVLRVGAARCSCSYKTLSARPPPSDGARGPGGQHPVHFIVDSVDIGVYRLAEA